jgi:recombination protein RecA
MAKKIDSQTVDSLASELVATLNSKFTQNIDKAAYFLSDPDLVADIKKWVPTGCDMLDLAISNRPNAGWPVGRIIEITGLEASGKSLLAAYALKSTQQQGGLAIYIDTEAATSREYLQAIGIDIEKMVYIPLETLEDIFDSIEATIAKVRKTNKDVLVTIVVDSIMGATTKKELEGEHGKDGYATEKSIVLSKAMRKITNMLARQNVCLILTNQLRVRMGVSFGDPYGTSGGKAVGFHSSVRIRLKSLGQIKMKLNGVDQVIGIKTRAIVQKNRLGPPLKSVDYDIYFESGIDNYGSWLETLKTYKLATSGQYWSIPLSYSSVMEHDSKGKSVERMFNDEIVNPETGELKKTDGALKFRSKDFGKWLEANPKLKEFLYSMICDRCIMTYKVNQDFGIDDIVIDDDFISEDD